MSFTDDLHAALHRVAASVARMNTAELRTALLQWYHDAARDLPWRRTRDPYAIWVSEVMSQQTRVETVVDYYDRWMRRFPDVDALARASIDDVLGAWEGLGYYTRARNLHAAAAVVREKHAGAVPADSGRLRTLPGIGEYTAGAIASIAFDEPVPAVDGNVRRVLARLHDTAQPTASQLRTWAAELVPTSSPGDWNQAMMELGARVCTPRSPRCDRCPVATQCAARANGTQAERPAPAKRRPVPHVHLATVVLTRNDGRVLVTRRPDDGLLARLWNFPAAPLPCGPPAAPGDTAATALTLARSIVGAIHDDATYLGTVEHVFTHRVEHYHCWRVQVHGTADVGSTETSRWIGEQRRGVTLPRAQQRILALALAAAGELPSEPANVPDVSGRAAAAT